MLDCFINFINEIHQDSFTIGVALLQLVIFQQSHTAENCSVVRQNPMPAVVIRSYERMAIDLVKRTDCCQPDMTDKVFLRRQILNNFFNNFALASADRLSDDIQFFMLIGCQSPTVRMPDAVRLKLCQIPS